MRKINKVVSRLKLQEVRLKYSKLRGDKWYITVFADASKGNMGNRVESTIAYLILLSDGYDKHKTKKCNVLTWQSRKARRVCVSTYDAEAMALNMGIQAGIVMKTHIKEIMNWGDEMIKVEAFTDCMDVYNAVAIKNKPDKPLQKGDQLSSLDIAAVRKYLQDGMIDDIQWVASEEQLCDTLTKLGKAPDNLVKAISEGEF